jgi:hypothetical protein
MEFNPNNSIVRLCLQGMDMEAEGHLEEADKLFLRAWNEATNDFEKYLAAYYLARRPSAATQNRPCVASSKPAIEN